MRYRLRPDDDGHWYLIPADKVDEFDNWVYEGVEAGEDMPEWAEELGSHPSFVTFENPELE